MPGQRRRTQNINDLIDSNASGYVPLPQLPSQYMNAMNGDYAYAQAVEEAAQQTADKAKKVRPKNTTKSYERRKKEFLEWCHKHCPPGALNEIPDDRKLHFFLVTQVVNREYKKKGTKRKQPQDSQVENSDATPSSSAEVDQSLPTDSDLLQTGEIPGEVLADSQLRDELLERAAMTSDTVKRVGLATVKMYIAAVVDLHNEQSLADPHSNRPHPHGKLVDALLQSLKYEEQKHKRDNYVDRGVGTVADGYSTTAEMVKLVDHYFRKNTQEGLRNGTAFLLQHYGLLRGESIRMMEFPDLQCMLFENEGISTCYALVMVLKQGKTNQEGRLEFSACLRNKNILICPQMMLSCYLFYRWHIAGEPFPDFNENRDWFDYKLTRSRNDPKASISYDHHLNCVKEAFKAVGLNSKAKTHAMRGSGSRMAEMFGTSEAAIQRLGRWNNSALTSNYLTHLPREALRTLAGFTKDAGQFYLVRSTVMPPEELLVKVFPRVDYWLERISKEEVLESSTAADGFLNLLVQMRVVFLQDSVILKQKFPDHLLWFDPLFQDELYLQFERDLNNALANSDDPRDLLLQRAMPRVETHLSNLNTQVSLLSNQVQTLTSLVQGFQSFPADVFRQLEPFLSVNNQARLMMEQWNRVVTQGATLNVRINALDLPAAGQSEVNQESSSLSHTTSPAPTSPAPAPAPTAATSSAPAPAVTQAKTVAKPVPTTTAATTRAPTKTAATTTSAPTRTAATTTTSAGKALPPATTNTATQRTTLSSTTAATPTTTAVATPTTTAISTTTTAVPTTTAATSIFTVPQVPHDYARTLNQRMQELQHPTIITLQSNTNALLSSVTWAGAIQTITSFINITDIRRYSLTVYAR